jgi:hypothetical protein
MLKQDREISAEWRSRISLFHTRNKHFKTDYRPQKVFLFFKKSLDSILSPLVRMWIQICPLLIDRNPVVASLIGIILHSTSHPRWRATLAFAKDHDSIASLHRIPPNYRIEINVISGQYFNLEKSSFMMKHQDNRVSEPYLLN